jgi:putative membrane protein
VLGVVDWLFSDVHGGTHGQLLLAAAVFGVLNTLLKPILRFITAPLALFTLGLAWFFVSMFMLWLTAVIVPGFSIHGFWTYVWATIVIWLLNVVVDAIEFYAGRGRNTGTVVLGA